MTDEVKEPTDVMVDLETLGTKPFSPILSIGACAFRMDDAVPLVVPEINAADVKAHKGIIANPNCTTAITLMALYPLHKAFGVTRIFASSYQGTGNYEFNIFTTDWK